MGARCAECDRGALGAQGASAERGSVAVGARAPPRRVPRGSRSPGAAAGSGPGAFVERLSGRWP
eukprot:5338887-Alexandrium_andersonii.AAC.1